MMRYSFVCTMMGVALMSAAAVGQDWSEFRGPGGQGHALDAKVPLTWAPATNVTWRTPLPGRGWSSPVVVGNQIWMTTADDTGTQLSAVAVDLPSGKLIGQIEIFTLKEPLPINTKNSYASPTPVADGDRVFVHFGTVGTAALDTKTGTMVWKNDTLPLDHKEGPGSSPISYRDLLIFNGDGMDVQFVAALDKRTGKVVWKTKRTGQLPDNPDLRKAYCTPLIIEAAGREQLVSPGAERVVSYDPRTGQEIWRVDYSGFSNVPRPVFANGLVYVVTGYMRPVLLAIRPDGQGNVTESHVEWRYDKQVPHLSSPIVVGGQLYMISGKGVLTCLDAATGDELWVDRLAGNFAASPLYANGHLFFPNEQGRTYVVRPGARFDLVATNTLAEGIFASPAVVGDTLLLRTTDALYRIEEVR